MRKSQQRWRQQWQHQTTMILREKWRWWCALICREVQRRKKAESAATAAAAFLVICFNPSSTNFNSEAITCQTMKQRWTHKYRSQGGVCVQHGTMTKKRCSSDECANKVSSGGVCIRHGAKKFRYDCSAVGCTNKAQIGGVCIRHGANSVHATDVTIVAWWLRF